MNDDNLNRRAAALLDEHADALDGPTRARLHQARNRALAGVSPVRRVLPWAGAGAVAAGIFAVTLLVTQATPPLPAIYEDPLQQAAAEDMELMDDLEFMAWLVLEEDYQDDAANNS